MAEEKRKIKEGDRVKWNDPGINDYAPEDREWVLNRVFIVNEIEACGDDDTDRLVEIVEEDGHSEAQAWEHELELIE